MRCARCGSTPTGWCACIRVGRSCGRGAVVEESWRRILEGPGRNQFIVTNDVVAVHGDLAWVTLDENLVQGASTGTVAATNVFANRTTAGS